MHPLDYFKPVRKLAFHNLASTQQLPPAADQLLGLGLKFIPTPRVSITPTDVERSLARLERDIGLRVFFAGDDPSETYEPNALRGTSIWRAPLPPREIDTRIQTFAQNIEQTFTPRETHLNLSKLQQTTLLQLKRNKNITILSADKGLGPVGVDTKQYVEWGLKHLLDTTTYSILSNEQAIEGCNTLYKEISQWICNHRQSLDDDTTRYIRERVEKARADPFGYFYLLVKLHKTPVSTRPVCSDCASLPHSIGKWVDKQLQPIVRQQQTYFQDSFTLKRLLENLETLPPNACLFTYDAISMYTNINTEDCLHRLESFLSLPATIEKYPHLAPRALIEALNIVMHNNRMKFGNMFVRQHKGIAMGMAPAPSIANLFVAIYEEAHVSPFPSSSLHFLRRFIDDGFGIWLRDPNQQEDDAKWESFQSIINGMGLQWEFSDRSSNVTFMDLNIHLRRGRLFTSLYAKPMALHLYIPPTSCHAPGIATGLVFGHFFRIFELCSHQHDIEQEMYLFFKRLLDRGYTFSQLAPLFLAAESQGIRHAEARRAQPENPQTRPMQAPDNDSQKQIFFHLQYHPSNPSSREIQQLWRSHILSPPERPHLNQLRNRDGYPITINRLVVAFSRAPNLGNLLSCRKLRVNIEDFTDTPLLQLQHTDNTVEDEETEGIDSEHDVTRNDDVR